MKRKYLYVMAVTFFMVVLILSGCGKASKTTISLESGEYKGEQEVVLTSGGKGDIYYTLDGSDPKDKEHGLKYNPEKPLKINFDTILKAYTKNGNAEGLVEEKTYTIKEVEVQQLTSAERGFIGTITGNYKSGDAEIKINSDRTVEWKDKNGSGTSSFTVIVPEGTEGYQGTLIYTNAEGKEAKFEIDCLPQGDDAIFINGINYDYLG